VVTGQDKNLVCKDCGQEFVWTAGEQYFYLEKGLANEPRRCPKCRASKRHERDQGRQEGTTEIVCAKCGKGATVPFVPRLDRPVYCDSCFSEVKAERAKSN